MGALEIGLLAAGLICFVISFFLSEKLSSSDINEFEKMSKAEINTIVNKQLREADNGIKDMIDDGMKDAMENFDNKADKLLNQKIMSISDYSDSVLASMEKSHKEIVFMYNMLIEKQENLTELTKDIQALESNLRQIKANMEESIRNGEYSVIESQLSQMEAYPDFNDVIEDININQTDPIEQVLVNAVNTNVVPEDGTNQNDLIIKMHNEGFDEVEIAKRLGRGLGEIKLILGLFNKE